MRLPDALTSAASSASEPGAVVVALLVAQACTLAVLIWVTLRLRRAHRELRQAKEELADVTSNRAFARSAGRWAMKTVLDAPGRVRQRGLVGGLLMAPIEELTGIALQDREEIAAVAAPDGAVTIMFSDIEGSTELNEELGDDAWVRVLAEHDRIVRTAVSRQDGHVVKSQGDGFMVVFTSAQQAVDAAVTIQRNVTAGGGRLRRTPIRVRIGIHEGTAVARDGDYFGRNVAKAARVAALADGGQTLVTDEVRRSLAAQDSPPLLAHGEHRLKGLSGAHHLWALAG